MGLTLVPTGTLSPMLRIRPPRKVDDFCVLQDEKHIGRIKQYHGGFRDGRWYWQVRVEARLPGRPAEGTEDSFEQAKAALMAAVSLS